MKHKVLVKQALIGSPPYVLSTHRFRFMAELAAFVHTLCFPADSTEIKTF